MNIVNLINTKFQTIMQCMISISNCFSIPFHLVTKASGKLISGGKLTEKFAGS